jgi:hypothetical protein
MFDSGVAPCSLNCSAPSSASMLLPLPGSFRVYLLITEKRPAWAKPSGRNPLTRRISCFWKSTNQTSLRIKHPFLHRTDTQSHRNQPNPARNCSFSCKRGCCDSSRRLEEKRSAGSPGPQQTRKQQPTRVLFAKSRPRRKRCGPGRPALRWWHQPAPVTKRDLEMVNSESGGLAGPGMNEKQDRGSRRIAHNTYCSFDVKSRLTALFFLLQN